MKQAILMIGGMVVGITARCVYGNSTTGMLLMVLGSSAWGAIVLAVSGDFRCED